ncbi:hypothetical protein Moror_9199 [Moniliophthora roreri MCA 2997]|uniref:Uncharacterized protein n=1 Tax=Moniliophthora roreri (strain MCA 2997) TaxID=1381753 RepID=V2WDS1_MONRO|nr:hypothetical protein Moror_9199 [Moniliophthora roreri MCA 2997]KAI3621061.1 hypothetical protein WG66_003251 [Moniliophthora roreri]
MLNGIPAKYHPLHLLTTLTHVICISILSYLIGKRTPSIHELHPAQWKHLTWGKVYVFLAIIVTWIFALLSGVLMTGVGTGDPDSCLTAILSCFILPGISKCLIYAFLVEKVYIVWSGGCYTSRLKTEVYKICIAMLLVYIVMSIYGFIRYHTSYITEDGACVFGYKGITIAVSLLETYNVLQSLFFALLFVWPLWRLRVTSPRLRAVAKKTLYGTLLRVAMTIMSTVAFLVLGGTELALVCVTFYVAEGTINALILHWMNSEPGTSIREYPSLPEINITADFKAENTLGLGTDYTVGDEFSQKQSDIEYEGDQTRRDHLDGKRICIVYPQKSSATRRYSI